jgi:hypothetical protein
MKLLLEYTNKLDKKIRIKVETSRLDQTLILERIRNDGLVEKKKISISKNNKLVIT